MDDKEVSADLSIDEAVATIVADLPEAVQRFVTSPRRDEVSRTLSAKHGLHADQAGDFEHAYMFMLLGIHTPEDFAKELRDAGLPEATIQGLAADVNDEVFKKLREEERTGVPAPVAAPVRPQVPVMAIEEKQVIPANLPGQEPLPSQPMPVSPPPVYTAPQQPVAAPVQPIPQMIPNPAYVPPAPPPPVQYTPPAYTPPPAPVQAPPVVAPEPVYAPPTQQIPQAAPVYQAPPPIYSNPAPVAAPVEVPHPAARTMASDVELLTQGYQAVVAGQPFQAPVAQPAYTPPPAPTVQMPQPEAAPTYPAPAMASVHLTPVDRTHSNAPITKEYGSDPYREPIE